ncbi:TA system VapC family ribonuclease toxin [Nocardioides caeni]|uniref:Ribonuclease VapC n=1 Tax=Nocardioides caeni TaxID=574700 RepID=A0A4S8N049_9ACTN|nr:TA system VapC family ribonuclease toxin [Nocardioides caeni]THV08995.1 PIN domain-containing protein [Nocardioides caeni]
MSRALLDVNVLLALFDADHADHRRAWDWLRSDIGAGWASCPLTQNGFVRIISQPRYPNAIPTGRAIALLSEAAATEHHEFWPDEVSVLDGDTIRRDRVHGPGQLTDLYLLATAVARGGRFITFDDGIPLSAVRRARPENLVVL